MSDDIERLQKRIAWLEAEYRRVCEELDFRDEKIRALIRALVRLNRENSQ